MSRREIFIESLNKFIDRNGENLTNSNIEPLVINLAYLEVLNSRKSGSIVNDYEVLKDYANIAKELIPYFSFNTEAVLFGYQATLQWDGIWDFIRNYFRNTLGSNIDEVKLEIERFDSSSHTREQFGQLVSKSEVNRKVEIIFSENKRTILVSIATPELGVLGGLSEKKAILEIENEHNKVYRGIDPDYRFTIVYDRFGTIEEFILDILTRSLRIIYHE
jgi:hypothetical protein